MTEMDKKDMKKSGKEDLKVWYLYGLFVIAALVVLCRIVYIQCFFRNSDPNLKYYTATSRKMELEPARGSIISSDGRLLAVSTPMYKIYMDCTVRKVEFKDDKEGEEKWRGKARELSKGLAAIFGKKSADGWYNDIIAGRKKGSKYMLVGGPIDHETMLKVKALPLFSEGANKGGIIVERVDTRLYPYGSLARSTIGYVRDNHDSTGLIFKGIEGAYDHHLHGQEGYKWMKRTDGKRIQDKDSTWANAKDGLDVKTTLSVDVQDIADRALRGQIADNEKIEGGCVIVMDVKTGAIRAMVNLLRDSTTSRLGESMNMAIMRAGEPGSVFKTAILTSLLEDGKVKLSDEIPTEHGVVKGFKPDQHIVDYERATGKRTMSVLHGYEISSNYIFRKLAVDHYGSNPKKLLDNLYLYRLGEAFDFDLEGLARPQLPPSDTKKWSATDLGSVAIGYSVSETPLHIVTFYNAIANKGKMMRPYLVEGLESNGITRIKKGPSVLNGSICSRAVADSVAKGLMAITEEGTAARRLKDARCKVAGKTGTARIVLDRRYAKVGANPYEDIYGRRQYQATFVGFFPAENPQYSVIVTAYSKLSREIFYGGTIPAMVCREIVDELYALDSGYGEKYDTKGPMPDLSGDAPRTAKNGKVPGLKGMGLMDAIYAIENDGYKCQYSGCGHVVSQSPEAGASLASGGTVTIRLD